jgi:hypothetical protein
MAAGQRNRAAEAHAQGCSEGDLPMRGHDRPSHADFKGGATATQMMRGSATGVKGMLRWRHCNYMRLILCLTLLFAACARADETADRAAIERVVGALNQTRSDAKPPRALFTSDADTTELDRFVSLNRQLLEYAGKPWSEVTAPRIVSRSIRFVTPVVALADAAIVQYGSVILTRSIPIVILVKRTESTWRIAALRMMADCPPQMEGFGGQPSPAARVGQ